MRNVRATCCQRRSGEPTDRILQFSNQQIIDITVMTRHAEVPKHLTRKLYLTKVPCH